MGICVASLDYAKYVKFMRIFNLIPKGKVHDPGVISFWVYNLKKLENHCIKLLKMKQFLKVYPWMDNNILICYYMVNLLEERKLHNMRAVHKVLRLIFFSGKL